MANETITQVEDAILAELNKDPLGPVGGSGYLKKLDSYQGDLEDDDVERIIKVFPAVLVIFDSDDYAPSDSACLTYDQLMRFRLLVAAKNLRGEKSRRRGDEAHPGIYQMLDDIRDLLAGKKLLPDIGPMRPRASRLIVTTQRASVYEFIFETSLDYSTV